MELLAEQPAEQLESDFETESDGETEKEERMYDETLQYLMHGRYPEGASKQDKGVIRKRSKHYRARDGQLYRVCTSKNKQEERVCLVIKDVKTRRQVFEGLSRGASRKP